MGQSDSSAYLPASVVARQRLGLPLVGRIVLYAGRFAPTHPLDLLMDAAPMIMDRVKLVHFVLIGDGVTRHRLEAVARERSLDAAIIFAGDVPTEQVRDFMVASDVGLYISSCFGSQAQTFQPDELAPFLDAGRAVVAASDLPDARMFVQVNNIGCVSEITGQRSKDVAALALAMSSMLCDDRARVRRAENAKRLSRNLASDTTVLGFLKAGMRRAAAL
jgi:glycosyltransferase involved in cell wall biosynthesis